MSSNTYITSTGQRRKKVRLMFGSRKKALQSLEQSELQQPQPQPQPQQSQTQQQKQQPAQQQNEQETALHSRVPSPQQAKADTCSPPSHHIPWPSILNPVNVKSGRIPFPSWIMNKTGPIATLSTPTSPRLVDTNRSRKRNSIGEVIRQVNDTTNSYLAASSSTTHERSSVQQDTTPTNDVLSSPITKAPVNDLSLKQLPEANEGQHTDNGSPAPTREEQVLSPLVPTDRPSLKQSINDNGDGGDNRISALDLDSPPPIATQDAIPTQPICNQSNNSYIDISDDDDYNDNSYDNDYDNDNDFYYLSSVGDNLWDTKFNDNMELDGGASSQAQKSHESASTPISSKSLKDSTTNKAHSTLTPSSVATTTAAAATTEIIVLDDDDEDNDDRAPVNSPPSVTPQTLIPPPLTATAATTTNETDIDPTPAAIDDSPLLTTANMDFGLPPSPLPRPLQHISETNPQATDTIPDADLPRIAINEGHDDSAPIYIHPHFVRYLKKHQVAGVQFMWNQLMGKSTGCILAHCMGLGKTLQVVVVVTTLFIEIEKGNPDIPRDVYAKRILVLAPLITLTNWMNEFDRWVPPDMASNISHVFNSADINNIGDNRRVQYVRRWYNDGGIMLMNYDKFRSLLVSARRKDYEVMLLKPSLVILDEAHRIKNAATTLTDRVLKIKTLRRICLTGYPLQNNLNEYYCMIDFAYPGLLGNNADFQTTFRRPIEAVYADSTNSVRHVARSQLLTLQLLTNSLIQREDSAILDKELFGKTEYYITCRLTSLQFDMYTKVLEKLSSYDLFFKMMVLRALCNHPAVFKKMLLNNTTKTLGTKKLTNEGVEVIDVDECAIVRDHPKQELRDWSNSVFASQDLDVDAWEHSHKIRIIISISELCRDRAEKLIIVSHSIISLDYLQTMLEFNDFNVSRIDGATPQPDRQPIIDRFNDDDTLEVMLLSAKAGGIGVNITSANRMILMDTDWNPSHDEQSIGRVYRFGQKKHVFIYRLSTHSTIESRVVALGTHKRSIAKRVVDNQLGTLQTRSDLRMSFCPPKENPRNEINAAVLDQIVDPVLKAALIAEKGSVVGVDIRGMDDAQDDIADLNRIELSPVELVRIRQTARDMLRNARNRHIQDLKKTDAGFI